MTNYDFNVCFSIPKYQKLYSEFGKGMNFNMKQKGGKSDNDRPPINFLKSPAIMATGI